MRELLILSIIISISIYHSFGLNTDGVLLLSFKFSIISDPLHVLDSWTVFTDTPCSWHGVSCGTTSGLSPGSGSDSGPDSDLGRVTGISLPGSQLLGTIPANFGLLDRLQTLDLSANSINGSIPDTVYSLSTLRVLDVAHNRISGELSDSLGGLRSLEVLNVSNNAFTGNIPRNLGSLPNLTTVSLRGNHFTGNLPGGFDRVRFMDLSSNKINGSLPVDFIGENIQFFIISNNGITGEIPPDFGRRIPRNATINFSYNNFTGQIPDSIIFQNQNKSSFVGNSDLCGPPLESPCGTSSSLSPTALPTAMDEPIPPPAIAAIPKTFGDTAPDDGPPGPNQEKGQRRKSHGLKPQTIAWIVVGDAGGIAILCMILLYIYKRKTKNEDTSTTSITTKAIKTRTQDEVSLSSTSSSFSESKGIARWACLRKGKNNEEDYSDDEESEDEEENEEEERHEEKGRLVTVDGESELELETLLRASAYILGASGASIMYKAVLDDGNVLAVRRVGECGNVEKLKEFESLVRGIAKMVHPNVVRVRGFYWAVDEKLVIYEFVPGGSLANARYSPCPTWCKAAFELIASFYFLVFRIDRHSLFK
ncbi:hypothetical protein KSS87_007561 [Heliosperma pusillum]|nr:hypothetical protein KSS87_007561 [Heliosperma pusillum]